MSEPYTHINLEDAMKDLDQFVIKRTNIKPALRQFGLYMANRTRKTFLALGKGGTFRGVTWPKFANQYKRKDGTVIPAAGGVKRVRAGVKDIHANDIVTHKKVFTRMSRVTGNVRGRRRPSGKRVTAQSQLLRDSGQLMNSTVNKQAIKVDDTGLHMSTQKKYGVWQQKRRKFLFFEAPTDINALRGFIMKQYQGQTNG